ncbi:uncharacterized protein MYCFIDRAFT_211062 [Pseudocercospora fijiensis CIRAD86]|uniref:Uncharacterized protein n=1 Tax=Pseudocercospora fijiensis (strain CIRAD86) TaxID=383855 RepID=M3B746_PSEFD|nr:uncharacterized protein MYCFIDRAFT_211062 [Pseudocercospora fijiensis CIRAD86]EME85153.1 hypothetical protein MYCFIDRAFT_211062 [Pseudocercospora fijiensis CIRAD86]
MTCNGEIKGWLCSSQKHVGNNHLVGPSRLPTFPHHTTHPYDIPRERASAATQRRALRCALFAICCGCQTPAEPPPNQRTDFPTLGKKPNHVLGTTGTAVSQRNETWSISQRVQRATCDHMIDFWPGAYF